MHTAPSLAIILDILIKATLLLTLAWGAASTLTANLAKLLPKLLIGLWLVGALFFLMRWRLNTMRLARLIRRAGVLTDSGWNAQVRALAADLGISRHVALLISDEIEVP